MSVIPYVENPAWADGSGGGTPINAAKLNAIEQGITDAHLMPAVRVYHSGAQAVLNNTFTALAFNLERFDQAGGVASTMHDTVTNNSRLTCRHAGIFLITGGIEWSASPGASAIIEIYFNGTTVIQRQQAESVDYRTMFVSTIYPLAVNEYVELRARQVSGGSINVLATANYSPEFGMVRVA